MNWSVCDPARSDSTQIGYDLVLAASRNLLAEQLPPGRTSGGPPSAAGPPFQGPVTCVRKRSGGPGADSRVQQTVPVAEFPILRRDVAVLAVVVATR